jgi:S1-C subfamily serine protease
MDMLIPSTETQPESVTEWEEKHYDPRRMEVLGVRRDSPAAKAGLQRGDRIVEFDGQTFPTTTDLRLYIFTLPIGKQVPVTVKRGGVKAHLMLEVAPKRKYDAEFSL